MTTRPFKADPGWELQWNANGSLGVIVRTALDGERVAHGMSSGTGRTYVGEGGTFTIVIDGLGDGPWTLRAVQVPQP